MSRVSVRQLEVFHAILQTGSATRAAEALKISQPSVSKLLRELEKATGLRLFDRVRKRLNPTAEARRLGLEVEGLYLKLNRVERIANELRAKGVGELRVASLPALGFRVVPACLARFRQMHPEIRVVLSVVPSQRVVNMVAEGEADVGFAYPVPGTPATLARDCLAILPAVAALPRGHALTAKRRLSLQDLVGQPIITLGREDRSRDKMEALLTDMGLLFDVVMETQFAALACELVSAGGGIAFIDQITARVYRDRIVTRTFDPSFDFDFGALTKMGSPASPVVDRFVSMVAAAVNKMAKDGRALGA
jgi:DNA-binding transcriptional LysR family regulator